MSIDELRELPDRRNLTPAELRTASPWMEMSVEQGRRTVGAGEAEVYTILFKEQAALKRDIRNESSIAIDLMLATLGDAMHLKVQGRKEFAALRDKADVIGIRQLILTVIAETGATDCPWCSLVEQLRQLFSMRMRNNESIIEYRDRVTN